MVETNEFILIGVDDHILEPPEPFVHHLEEPEESADDVRRTAATGCHSLSFTGKPAARAVAAEA